MPEISRFLGIVIYMYFNAHNPPHFHVEYNEYKAAVLIDSLGIMQGKLPPKVFSLVVEWGLRTSAGITGKLGFTA
jgi:hypothetical protein